MKKILLAIVIGVLLVAAASAQVGFKLNARAVSSCGQPRCVPGNPEINQSIVFTDHSSWVARYCGTQEANPGACDITVGNTQHGSSDIVANLRDVYQMNPGWFAQNGYGSAVPGGAGTPSATEIWDAYFTQQPGGAGYALFREAVRLRCLANPFPGCGEDLPVGQVAVCGNGRLELGETCTVCCKDHPEGSCGTVCTNTALGTTGSTGSTGSTGGTGPVSLPDRCNDPLARCQRDQPCLCPPVKPVKPCVKVQQQAVDDAKTAMAGYKPGPNKKAARNAYNTLVALRDWCAAEPTGATISVPQ